ncbi:multitransmembrane protein [Elysia marginata]|uniref:Multitransmembrane protein n=1 Tax=Elysia marginata TaxID=1093978 RepID=A0AAV4HM39_9GAST|nr:multitransmembrane protein [Elysia marginata]
MMEALLNVSMNSSFDVTPLTRPKYLYAEERLWSIQASTPAWPFIIVFGLVSNITNIIVFSKAGVKDNVSTLLFSLAISDIAFLILISPHACFWVIWTFTSSPEMLRQPLADYERSDGVYPWPFHYQFVFGLFYWPAFTASDLSTFISLSLGVMRCACVAIPLKFKAVFTKSRTVKWVVFLVVLAVALRAPVLTIFRVTPRLDPATNTTHPYVSTVNIASMSRINDIVNRGFVIWFNYVVMVSCVCLLSYKLYQASKIRRSCTNKTSPQSAQSMSSTDVQVVKSVVLVCTIFILAQLPLLLVSLSRLLNMNFQAFGRLMGLFGLISNVALTCSLLNASVNIFVYYNFNSKYKAAFLSLFRSSNTTNTRESRTN